MSFQDQPSHITVSYHPHLTRLPLPHSLHCAQLQRTAELRNQSARNIYYPTPSIIAYDIVCVCVCVHIPWYNVITKKLKSQLINAHFIISHNYYSHHITSNSHHITSNSCCSCTFSVSFQEIARYIYSFLSSMVSRVLDLLCLHVKSV